jgi:hypothetical protein
MLRNLVDCEAQKWLLVTERNAIKMRAPEQIRQRLLARGNLSHSLGEKEDASPEGLPEVIAHYQEQRLHVLTSRRAIANEVEQSRRYEHTCECLDLASRRNTVFQKGRAGARTSDDEDRSVFLQEKRGIFQRQRQSHSVFALRSIRGVSLSDTK